MIIARTQWKHLWPYGVRRKVANDVRKDSETKKYYCIPYWTTTKSIANGNGLSSECIHTSELSRQYSKVTRLKKEKVHQNWAWLVRAVRRIVRHNAAACWMNSQWFPRCRKAGQNEAEASCGNLVEQAEIVNGTSFEVANFFIQVAKKKSMGYKQENWWKESNPILKYMRTCSKQCSSGTDWNFNTTRAQHTQTKVAKQRLCSHQVTDGIQTGNENKNTKWKRWLLHLSRNTLADLKLNLKF